MSETATNGHGHSDHHSCACCGRLFTSLEDYVHHKMTSEKCRKNLNFDKKKILQQLMGPPAVRGRRRGRPPLAGRCRQLHEAAGEQSAASTKTVAKNNNKDGKYNRLLLHHKQSDILSDRSGYTCTRCPRSFRRQAALNRHIEYDHREKMSDESDMDDSASPVDMTTIDSGRDDKDYAPKAEQITEIVHVHDVDDLPTQTVTPPPAEAVHETSHILNMSMESVTADGNVISSPKTCIIRVVNRPDPVDSMDNTDDEYVKSIEYLIIPHSANVPENSNMEKVEQSDNVQDDTGAHTTRVTSSVDSRPTPAVPFAQEVQVEREPKDVVTVGNNCMKCCRSFKDKYVMRAHMLTHTNVRTYRCTFKGCAYASKTKGSLKRHMRRHTGERPFKCKLCGRAFRESGCLSRHLKSRGVCSDRSDSDFPRYKKNLRLGYSVENEENFNTTDPETMEGAISSVIQITGEPTLHQVLQEAGPDVEEAVRLSGESEVVLVPVSPSRAAEIEHITTEDGTTYIQLASTDHLTQLMPVNQRGGPQQEVLWRVISEEEINSHQGLSLEIAAEGDQQQAECTSIQIQGAQSDHLEMESDQLQENDQPHENDQLENESEQLESHQIQSGNEPLQAECDLEQEEAGHCRIQTEPHQIDPEQQQTENDQNDRTVLQLGDTEALQVLDPVVEILSPAMEVETMFVEETASMKQRQGTDLVVIHDQAPIKEELDGMSDPSNIEYSQENPETFICVVDKQSFNSKAALEAHLKMHMAHPKFSCNRCTFSTDSQTDMDDHMQISHLKRWVTSDATPQGDQITVQEVVVDPQTNAELQKVLGYTCKSTFPSTADAQPQAQQQQTGTEEACLALEQLRQLKGDSRGHVGQTECLVCEKSFKTSTTLKNHMLLHTGTKCHRCNKCDKMFYTKDSLNKHMVAHSKARNYKCGECGKMFKRISHVREHLKVHSNYRPYPCRICFRLFKSVNACKVHMRTHTDVLQHECPKCHKNFREKGALLRHIRTHTGEKPFVCRHCKRKFAEHGTLKRHLKAKVPCTKDLYGYRMQQQSDETRTMLTVVEATVYDPEHDESLDGTEAVEVAMPGLLVKEEVVQEVGESVDVMESRHQLSAADAVVLSKDSADGLVPDNVQYIYMDNAIHTDGSVILIAGNGEEQLELTVQPTDGSTSDELLQDSQHVVAMDIDSAAAIEGLSVVDGVVVESTDTEY